MSKLDRTIWRLTIYHVKYASTPATTKMEIAVEPVGFVEEVHKLGGFWNGADFIPWHSISYIHTEEMEVQP